MQAVHEGGTSPLIHIGYHKTASTLLQARLFTRADLGFVRLRDDLLRIHPMLIQYGPYDEPDDRTVAELRKEVAMAGADGLRLVLSAERFSGYPASGGYDSKAIADRIKSIFPEAKVLIFVREQKSMLLSYYLQYISDGGSLSFERLVTPIETRFQRMPCFDFRYFEYHRLVSYYKQSFGDTNVLVLPFESIRKSPVDIAAAMTEFAGKADTTIPSDIFTESVNKANPMAMQLMRRPLNGLIGRNQLSPHAPVGVPHFRKGYRSLRPLFAPTSFLDPLLTARLKRKIARAIGNRYAESNRILSGMVDWELSEFGYQLD